MSRISIALLSASVVLALTASVGAQDILIDPPGGDWDGRDNDPDIGPVDFATTRVGQTQSLDFKIHSIGATPLTIHSVEVQDDPWGVFRITHLDELPPELFTGQWLDLQVAYQPDVPGVHTATIKLISNDRELPILRNAIRGQAVAAEPPVVPEPLTILVFGAGLSPAAAYLRRRLHRGPA